MRNGFTLTERLYKTADGEIVREGDPRAAFVYRGAGRDIPMEEAIALGLVGEGETAQEEQAADGGEPADGDATTPETPEDLTALKLPELKAKATELGVEGAEKFKKKADAIAAIEAAQEEQAADGGE